MNKMDELLSGFADQPSDPPIQNPLPTVPKKKKGEVIKVQRTIKVQKATSSRIDMEIMRIRAEEGIEVRKINIGFLLDAAIENFLTLEPGTRKALIEVASQGIDEDA